MFKSKILFWSLVLSLTRLLDYICDSTGTILPVFKGDFSLAGSFNSDGQTSSSGLSGPDAKLSCSMKGTQSVMSLKG